MKTIEIEGKKIKQLTLEDLNLFADQEIKGARKRLVLRLFVLTNRYARHSVTQGRDFDVMNGIKFIMRYTMAGKRIH